MDQRIRGWSLVTGVLILLALIGACRDTPDLNVSDTTGVNNGTNSANSDTNSNNNSENNGENSANSSPMDAGGDTPDVTEDPGTDAPPDVPDEPDDADASDIPDVADVGEDVTSEPVATPGRFLLEEDQSLSLLLEGVVIEGATLEFLAPQEPENGTLTLFDDYTNVGALSYTPDPDFNGVDRFFFSVSDGEAVSALAEIVLVVSAVNDPPVAEAQRLDVDRDGSREIELLGIDIDSADLNYVLTRSPESGALDTAALAQGVVTYTPVASFVGTDSFSYTVSDGEYTSDEAVVTLDVLGDNRPPVAMPQTLMMMEDGELAITLTGVDPDLDETLSFEIVEMATEGFLDSLDEASGELRYIPEEDFFGQDSFTFSVSDGDLSHTATISIEVSPIDDPPVFTGQQVSTMEDEGIEFVLDATDIDTADADLQVTILSMPTNGEIALAGEPLTLRYTPDPNYNGTDSILVSICDASVCVEGEVAVTIEAVNDPPLARDWIGEMLKDQRLELPLGGIDIEGNALTYRFNSMIPFGMSILGDTLTFTPSTSIATPQNFLITYVVRDGEFESIGTLDLNVYANPCMAGMYDQGGGMCSSYESFPFKRHYTLDNLSGGTTADSGGASSPGSVVGGVSVSGVLGNAVQLDSGDYVQMDDMGLASGDMTIGVWVYIDPLAPAESAEDVNVFTHGDYGIGVGIALGIGWLGDVPYLAADTGSAKVLGTAPLEVARWTHLVVVVESGTARFYVDGVETPPQGSALSSIGIMNTGSAFLGWHPSVAGGISFDGSLDDFRLYNGVLSDSQIEGLLTGNEEGGISCGVGYRDDGSERCAERTRPCAVGYSDNGLGQCTRLGDCATDFVYDGVDGCHPPPGAHLTLRYDFDALDVTNDLILDTSGNGVNAYAPDLVLAPGYEGSALNAADTTTPPQASSVALTFQAHTIAMWVQVSETIAQVSSPLLNKGDGVSGGYRLDYGVLDGGGMGLRYRVGACAGGSSLEVPVLGEVDRWHFVVATYGADAATLYVDGEELATQASNGMLCHDNEPLVIGGDEVTALRWPGLIDDVRLINRPLSQAEVRFLLYNNTLSVQCDAPMRDDGTGRCATGCAMSHTTMRGVCVPSF